MSNNLYNNHILINLHKKKKLSSEIVTQMLYGEKFKLIKRFGKWWRIKLHNDNYEGFIIKKKFKKKINHRYKINCLKANIYKLPSTKKLTNKKLSFASRISPLNKSGSFIEFERNKWIKISDTKPINYKTKNIFEKLKIFKGTKYRWGGKNYNGVDCSAIIQLCFNFNNKYFPRDSKDQLKYLKKNIDIKKIKKNDLFFWKGHVAIAISKKYLIHAYAPYKKVVKMKINKTIEIIKNKSNLKLLSIKRI